MRFFCTYSLNWAESPPFFWTDAMACNSCLSIPDSTKIQWGESVCAHHVRVECEDFVLLVIEANDGSRGRSVTHEEHTIIALDTWAWHQLEACRVQCHKSASAALYLRESPLVSRLNSQWGSPEERMSGRKNGWNG